VEPPTINEAKQMAKGSLLISFVQSQANDALLKELSIRKITVYGMDAVPRSRNKTQLSALSKSFDGVYSQMELAAQHAFYEALGEYRKIPNHFRKSPPTVLVLGKNYVVFCSFSYFNFSFHSP
jgi:NAD/NADP transhydrogenase alpha subunit